MPRREIFLGLAHFRALHVADFRGQVFHGRGDHAQRREEHGVAVAGDHLGRNRLWRQAHLFGHVFLDEGVDVGEGADGAGNGAGCDFVARVFQAPARALEFRIEPRQLQAHGRRLGMDAVAAAHDRGHLVFKGAGLQRRHNLVDIVEQDRRRLLQLHGQAGVQNVRRGHALVDEAGVVADMLRQFRGEGDDVVLGLALDLVDAVDARAVIGLVALFPDGLGGLFWDHAQLGLRVAGMGLDLKPDAELVGGLPNGGHLGAGIARDHGNSVSGGKL